MSLKTIIKKYKLYHILFWMIVFAVWYYLRYEDYSSKTTAFKITLVKVIDLALLVYITNYVLIPRLLYRKKYIWFVVSFILMVVTSSVLKMQILGQIMNNPALYDLSENLKVRIYDNVIPHFFLVIAGAAIQFLLDYNRTQQRLTAMAKERAEAELNFLKSQINPHFLFNSLNTVYFLIDRQNADARQALHNFSEMLRYQLYEANGDRVPIEKEINYLRDYVHLQKLRKDENYSVQFNCSEDVRNFSIEPLLLIPFVENAFKHISNSHSTLNFVRVDMARSNGMFHFSIENSKERVMRTKGQAGGIGLQNVRRRLELLYPGKHELSIYNEEKVFRVNLNLLLS